MDEMFDATDTIDHSLENHYTVSDLEPGTNVYLRVAAAAGTLEAPILSPWSTHVTGTSDVPPEPEPTPAPAVMAMFSLSDDAKSPYFMVADDDDDKDSAMAWVNPQIMVESNTTAIITPTWLDGANGVSVDAGSNMPFTYVGAEDNWEMLQSMVLGDGATFMIQRTTVGANQMEEPTGDVAYVTCGPFECTESMMEEPDAPMLGIENSAVCEAWDPMVDIEVGFVTNVVDQDPDTAGTQATMDGVDLGWRTTSDVAMTVTHHFKGVARGRNISVAGPDAGKGSSLALKMTNDDVAHTKYGAALIVDDGGTADDATDDMLACAGTSADDPYGGSRASDLDKPEECFRVNTLGDTKTGTNYLDGYSIELAAKGSSVSWGEISWDQFKDLKCESKTYAATDLVNVCDLFEEEVDMALEKDWGGATYTLVTEAGADSTAASPSDRIKNLMSVVPSSAESKQFATVWFDNDGNDKATVDLYADADPDAADHQRPSLMFALLDDDNDQKYGDFGKVDLTRRNPDDETASDATDAESWEFKSDGKPDAANTDKCTDDDGGDGCDAEFSEMVDIKIASGSALGCETTRTVTITCSWDADGEMGRYRRDDHMVDPAPDGSSAAAFFAGLVTSADTGARAAGRLAAFAKCEVK